MPRKLSRKPVNVRRRWAYRVARTLGYGPGLAKNMQNRSITTVQNFAQEINADRFSRGQPTVKIPKIPKRALPRKEKQNFETFMTEKFGYSKEDSAALASSINYEKRFRMEHNLKKLLEVASKERGLSDKEVRAMLKRILRGKRGEADFWKAVRAFYNRTVGVKG